MEITPKRVRISNWRLHNYLGLHANIIKALNNLDANGVCYMDEITKENFMSIKGVGIKSWVDFCQVYKQAKK